MSRGPEGSDPIQRDERSGPENVEGPHVHAGVGDCTPLSGPDLHPCMTLFNNNFVNTGAVRTAGWISSRLVLARVSAAKGLQGKGAGIVWQQSMQSRPKNEGSERRLLQAWKRMLRSTSFFWSPMPFCVSFRKAGLHCEPQFSPKMKYLPPKFSLQCYMLC